MFHLEHGLVSPDDLIDVLGSPVFEPRAYQNFFLAVFQTFSTVLSLPLGLGLSNRELFTSKEYSLTFCQRIRFDATRIRFDATHFWPLGALLRADRKEDELAAIDCRPIIGVTFDCTSS